MQSYHELLKKNPGLENIYPLIKQLLVEVEGLNEENTIDAINLIKIELNKVSPFNSEPVDCVLWIDSNKIQANDYNPNIVAPPEMKLLAHSIIKDGYTQPIVAWENKDIFEVVDGYHRNRVGKENEEVKRRVNGYLPITVINKNSSEKGNRIAATIRHNRARGKHTVEGMSDIIIELKNRNWTNERISKNLGMDEDEILRLCQITGLSDLFKDQEFSKAWDIEDSENDFIPIDDDIEFDETDNFRTINTDDENRIFHTHDKWECFAAGLYKTTFNSHSQEECEKMYADFLSNNDLFENTLQKIITEWKFSCEHYLTNNSMNRIAYLGQAAVCYEKGLPNRYRGGFNILTKEQQNLANETALKYLNLWLDKNNRKKVTMEEAMSNKQMDLY